PIAVAVSAACGSSPAGPPADAGRPDAFIADAKLACTGNETTCDPFLSCSCGAMQKCTPGTSGLQCLSAGSKPPGDTCSSDGDCSRGTVCAPFAGVSTCLAFCDVVHPCGSGTFCYIVASDLSGHPVGMVCGPTCNLLAHDCTAGYGCYPSDIYGLAERGICLRAGGGTQGSACASMTDCALGYACIAPAPAGSHPPECVKICARSGGAPACSSTSSCQPLSGDTQTGV